MNLKYLPATYWLLGILIAVFIIQIISAAAGFPFTELLVLYPAAVIQGQMIWGVLTSVFLHSFNPIHLFFNGFVLYMFGLALERIIGRKNLLKVFLCSGLFASVFYVLTTVFILNSSTAALGASGAIFGVLGAMMALRPRTKILLYFFIPMELWMLGIFLTLLAVFWFGAGGGTGIAENAHLGGLIAGLVMGFYFRGKEKKNADYSWRAVYSTPTSNDPYDWIDNYR
jgi:uncharacterized protein